MSVRNWIIIGCIVAIAIPIIIWAMGVSNTEIGLRNKFEAQTQVRNLIYDNMWKTIQEKAAVADNYKDGMVECIEAAAKGREGGSLLKFVKEAVPGLSDNLYKEIMATIEGKRDEVTRQQVILTDIYNTHKNLVQYQPTSWVVGRRSLLKLELITSTRTKRAAQTGIDDELNIKTKNKEPKND